MGSPVKRQRLDGEETQPQPSAAKYPFIHHDRWMEKYMDSADDALILVSGPATSFRESASSVMSSRPTALWFSLGQDSKVSSQARSAQYSAVAHSPFVSQEHFAPTIEESEEDGMLLYSKWDSVRKYIEFRTQKIPPTISHPFIFSDLFFQAVVADVISNAFHRDPSLYKSVWPGTVMGIPVSNEGELADLAIARTAGFAQKILPWMWEKSNRSEILSEIIEGIQNTKSDLLIPYHGLILSPWFGGILFRLAQLFFKITVVRSQLSPGWDDSCFVFCQGKRESSKLVDKAFKLLTRLVVKPEAQSTLPLWGYSVPPACFNDPCLCDWLRAVNAQLMGSTRLTDQSQSLLKLASQFRLKKFLFPNASEQLVGFYFGSFNPVHENHIALALFAKERLGLDHVVFVPNNDENDEKKEVLVALNHRVSMLRARIEHIEGMEVMEPPKSTKRWESKAEIAEERTAKLFEESESRGQVALILGQDSWNNAVLGSSRDKVTRHFIGISKLVKTKFLVFPRTQESDIPVLPAPKPIRENVNVVEGFVDPIEGLSSSRLRQGLKNREMDQGTPIGLHPSVFQYICSNKLYLGKPCAQLW
jgi:nicotinate-nucleotide adenylyltransferase